MPTMWLASGFMNNLCGAVSPVNRTGGRGMTIMNKPITLEGFRRGLHNKTVAILVWDEPDPRLERVVAGPWRQLIAANRHHYEKPQVYVDCGWRNHELKRLLAIVEKFAKEGEEDESDA